MFHKMKVIENHYYDDKQIEHGRIWVSIFRLDLFFIYVEFKYPTWKKWTKTIWIDKNKGHRRKRR